MNYLSRILSIFQLILVLSLPCVSLAASDSVAYVYDSLGRLIQATYANGTTLIFAYDAAGNRSSKIVKCAASSC